MNADSLFDVAPVVHPPAPSGAEIRSRVLAYYNAATTDYRAWSKGFNMHFGYWRPGLNPFRREPMLHELNLQALTRLQLPTDRPARLADLGGGTGATARAAVAAYPMLAVDTVTLVPLQVAMGVAANRAAPRGEAITMHCADFAATQLPSAGYDAVCLIESACHAGGATKAGVLREAYRLLRPGGRLVMVDAMLVGELPRRGWLAALTRSIYRRWCASWAVPEMCRLDLLPRALLGEGFEAPVFEDWSWRIAPSVAHVPFLASRFAIAELVKTRCVLPPWRRRHIVASFLTPLLGLRRSLLRYGAMTAVKPIGSTS
ncbi:MAG: class I SAM-dependent methyltransferase [Caldimonas sp.]